MDVGLFLLLAGLAFILTLVSFRYLGTAQAFLRVLAMAIFLILAVSVVLDDGVKSEKTITDGASTWTETSIFVSSDDYWISYIFIGFGMLNFILMFKDILGGGK